MVTHHPSQFHVLHPLKILHADIKDDTATLILNENIGPIVEQNADFPFPSATVLINGKEVSDFKFRDNILVFPLTGRYVKSDSLSIKIYAKSDKNLFSTLTARY